MKRLVRTFVAVFAPFVIFASVLAGLRVTVGATPYGAGAYSSCSYNCPPPPTITTLPSGLQVVINLTSGQTIPLSGYEVTATPLNGQGASFQKVEFYVNGQLAFVAVPDSTGTAYWHWVPSSVGDVQLRAVIYGSDGSQTTDTFALHVSANSQTQPPTATGSGSTSPKSKNTPASSPSIIPPVLQHLGHTIRRAIQNIVRHIPVPVVYSFPYVLFALLGTLLLFFALQVRREIQDVLRLRGVVLAERRIAKEKETFLQLSEHYLRTPITLIRGGTEALGAPSSPATSMPLATVQRVVELGRRLQDGVESALSKLTSNQLLAGIPDIGQTSAQGRLWLSAGFLVPVIGCVGLLGIAEYLVQNIRQLNVALVNQFVQATIAGLLLVAFYQILRRRRLRRIEVEGLEESLQYQRAVDRARNEFIHDSALLFSADVQQLLASLPNVPGNTALATVREGCERFRKIVTQFTAASSLVVGRSQESLAPAELAGIFGQAQQLAAKVLADHRAGVKVNSTVAQIYCRQPQWLSFVLASLLDNAAMYGPEGGVVELGAAPDRLFVTDHGPGIPSDVLQDLFKPFTKGEGVMEFTHQGLGFSLYLDKLIMAYLGGDITVDSRAGQGTTMTLLLPQQTPDAAPLPALIPGSAVLPETQSEGV